MADTSVAGENVGVFTRDQVQILSARKDEPEWLATSRLAAYDAFAATAMPTSEAEDWRYTDIGAVLRLDEVALAEESTPVQSIDTLPAGLQEVVRRAKVSGGRLVQTDGSVVLQELPEALAARGVIFTSLELAVREHPELVRRYLGTGIVPEDGKFATLNSALWSGGLFLYVPRGVRVEVPLRAYRWISERGGAVLPRTLVVAEESAEVSLVDELGSGDFDRQAIAVTAAEIFADEGAKVNYVSVQDFGKGVVQLATDRLMAGRDARITTLYAQIGADLGRADIRCRMRGPGSHVDMLGVYIADGTQHFDNETLQDHLSPHASSNLLFKGALRDRSRSVFRGLIRVHPKAQRTDAYQTNRNLILSGNARADSLPNLEIQADDVRCSHAATVGQLDEEEIFYLLSRGVPKREAIRLVIFGFFAEVLDQLPLEDVRQELVSAVERKLVVAAS